MEEEEREREFRNMTDNILSCPQHLTFLITNTHVTNLRETGVDLIQENFIQRFDVAENQSRLELNLTRFDNFFQSPDVEHVQVWRVGDLQAETEKDGTSRPKSEGLPIGA